MSAHTKKHRTDTVEIKIGNVRKRTFLVPKEKAKGVLALVEEFEIEQAVDWRVAFEDKIEHYTEPGLILRGARTKEELTQLELAKLLETSQSHIAQMENGKREITKSTAKRLSKVLNVDYKIFL